MNVCEQGVRHRVPLRECFDDSELLAENFNRLSRVHERYRRQTDGRTTTDSEHEHQPGQL